MSIDAHPNRRRSLGLLCGLLVSLTAASALADTLAMQGVLRSGAGGPVADGEYGMEVALFADAAASQLVYKQLFIAVPVQAGLFAVVLGLDPANPLDGPAVAANAGFVRVTVGSEPPLPTQALSPALMAHRATLADQALVAQQAISAQGGQIGFAARSGRRIATRDQDRTGHLGERPGPVSFPVRCRQLAERRPRQHGRLRRPHPGAVHRPPRTHQYAAPSAHVDERSPVC